MLNNLTNTAKIWIAIGFTGQMCFFLRFLVQWIVSEKHRKSVIPVAFWYFSIAGGIILFFYSLYRRDPVFITGQCIGLFVYSRNLWLIHKHKRTQVF
ncbi:MAG TPA: lipid-A-disaccharide synthase N-terminal domain-containing protein [bacterium]|nr:lipid-A-disaccharide synthase N-terminal domain-containing protein [bacterium]